MTKRTFTIERALCFPLIRQVAVHPLRDAVAYVLQEAALESNRYYHHIYLAETGRAPRQLTRGPVSDRSIAFSSDGKFLGFLSSGRTSDKAGTQVWVLPTEGGEPFPVTDPICNVHSFQWSSDGYRLYYLTDSCPSVADRWRSDEARQRGFDSYVHMGDKPRREIWCVDIETRANRKVFNGGPGVFDFTVSRDEGTIAYSDNYTGLLEDYGQLDIWLYSVKSGDARRLTGREGREWAPAWSFDSTRLAFRGLQDPACPFSQADLFMSEGTGHLSDLTRSLTGDVAWHQWLDPRVVLVAVEQGLKTNVYRCDVDHGACEYLLSGTGFGVSADGRRLASLAADASSLPDVVLADLITGETHFLTNYRAELAEYELPAVNVIRWKGELDRDVEGILTLPQGSAPYPLIVAPHGGPHIRSTPDLDHLTGYQARVLAANGYAVLQPNYHGSSGYGNDFAVALYKNIGGIDYRDIMAGVDHVIREGIADANRLGLMGRSYGGYLTNRILTQTDRFKAAVSRCGIWSLFGDYGNTSEDLWQVHYCGCYYWENPEIYARLSPATYVTALTTPVLIMHGDEDMNVSPSNSQEMWHALHHLGRTVEYVRYPREAHANLEPNHQIDEVSRVLRWFQRFIPTASGASGSNASCPPVSLKRTSREGTRLLVEVVLRASEPVVLTAIAPTNPSVVLSWGGAEIAPSGIVAEGGALLCGDIAIEVTCGTCVTLCFETPEEPQDDQAMLIWRGVGTIPLSSNRSRPGGADPQ